MKKTKKQKSIRVLAFGAFDLLHPGHVDFLRRAKRLGNELIVSVARDVNVKKFKGYKPLFKETDRLKLVAALSCVNKAVLGEKQDYFKHILKLQPDVIALGYDQTAYVSELKRDLKRYRLPTKIVRLPAYHPGVYKSSKFKYAIRNSYA